MKISEARQRKILKDAARIMEYHAKYVGDREFLESPDAVKELFTTRAFDRKQEVFTVAFLDNRHRLIEIKDLFFGTIDSASVYPREIVREAIMLNAAALVLAHNHPSGNVFPSPQDLDLTKKLVAAGNILSIKILDHLIIGDNRYYSFADEGKIS